MNGKLFIDNVMYDIGRYQTIATDTALRAITLTWLNRTINYISGKHSHWRFLEKTSTFNTVSGTMSYDLPIDFDKVITLKQTNSPTKLIYLDQKYLDELAPDPTTSSGDPTHYTLFGASLRLYPVPSSVIAITERYIKTITAITDNTASTTDIPDKWDEVIISGAKVHAYKMFPQWGNSTNEKMMFEGMILDMIRDNDRLPDNDMTSYPHNIDGSGSLLPPFHYSGQMY